LSPLRFGKRRGNYKGCGIFLQDIELEPGKTGGTERQKKSVVGAVSSRGGMIQG